MKNYDKKNSKPRNNKPVAKIVSLVISGKDQKGHDYDVNSCNALIEDLVNAGCFDKLSISVSIARNRIVEDAKGTTTVGRLQNYEDGNFEVLLIGKNVAFESMLDDMVIIPRVRTEYNSTKVITILGFELVPTMEA